MTVWEGRIDRRARTVRPRAPSSVCLSHPASGATPAATATGHATLGRGAPLKFSPRFVTAAGALAIGLLTVGTAAAVQASPTTPAPTDLAGIKALAAKS